MFIRGLRATIAVNIFVLLIIAMFLIDYVLITAIKRDLIRSEVTTGEMIGRLIKHRLITGGAGRDKQTIRLNAMDVDYLKNRLGRSGWFCAMIADKHNHPVLTDDKIGPAPEHLKTMTLHALNTKKQSVRFSGHTWGVFWKQKHNLILSVPLFYQTTPVAAIVLVRPLDDLYRNLRQVQGILLVYMVINGFILTLVGVYFLSRSTINPLKRLVKRAEEYDDREDVFLLQTKGENEFAKLSKALNGMLKRISKDKLMLQQTVSSLEQSNRELRQAQKDIIRAEKLASVGKLSSGLAHEIGNPIGIVLGYLELLKNPFLSDEEKSDFIVRSEKEIQRINLIIRQLLDFSRTSVEGVKAVHVHEVILDVIDLFHHQPAVSDVKIDLDLTAEYDTIKADPDQLRQVFLNILFNAQDALSSLPNHRQGRVILKTAVVKGMDEEKEGLLNHIRIQCIDNGIGIDETNPDMIFDPFYTTKEPGKGTGLGLFVCYTIVENMDGRIKATGRSDEGTTITIYLPLSENKK